MASMSQSSNHGVTRIHKIEVAVRYGLNALPVLHEYVQPTNIKGMNFNKNVFIDEERKRDHMFPLLRKISIHLHQNNKKMLILNKF